MGLLRSELVLRSVLWILIGVRCIQSTPARFSAVFCPFATSRPGSRRWLALHTQPLPGRVDSVHERSTQGAIASHSSAMMPGNRERCLRLLVAIVTTSPD